MQCIVRDSGPGIPRDKVSQVFEPFLTTKADGLGLGLAVSRAIVEAHGGTMEALNAPDGGAVFKFTIPSGARARSAPPVLRCGGA